MRYQVRHATTLEYAAPVASARFNLRLSPAPCLGQTIGARRLVLSPEPDLRIEKSGPYCVNTTHIGFSRPIRRLDLESSFDVDIAAPNLPGSTPDIAALRAEALAERDISAVSPAPYLFASRIAIMDKDIAEWGSAFLSADQEVLAGARALNSAIHREFAYLPGATDSRTGPHEAFRLRKGVCQDFAHVMISALRANGIPAAYVSGYLRTEPPPGQKRLIGADAMHAWVKVWCGSSARWIGFDPTNDCLVREDHIQIGMGRDYADVAPIDGTFIGSAPQSMKVAVDVLPSEVAC